MADNILSLTGVCKAYGAAPVLDGVTLGIDDGQKVGMIGANGAGKSTLLRIIAGLEVADEGEVATRREATVAYLQQVPQLTPGVTIRDILREPFAPLIECIAAYERAAMAEAPDAGDLLERIELLGGWDYDHRVERAATQVGLPDCDLEVDILSGGERKRVALARVVLQAPDLILLDEPTNHLDADTVEWLEHWLAATPAAVLLITHDRYFLDHVINRIIELRGGQLRFYPGNYTDYIGARAIEEAQRERSRHRQLRLLMTELEWARRSPPARTTKSRARLDQIGDIQDEVRRLSNAPLEVEFDFGAAPRLGKTILEARGLCHRYGDGPALLHDVEFALHNGERLGVIGPNGAGKSTLLKIVLGELAPDSGELTVGKNTTFAYFDQERSRLDDETPVRDIVCPDGDFVFPGGRKTHVAGWLDRFGFSKRALLQRVGTLSGGERNRLALAVFLLEDANVLVLDEPTNDLDIDSLNVLEEALLRFEGCVIVVTHDRYFLDKIATGLLAFEQAYLRAGTVTYLPGEYTHYRDHRLAQLKADRQERQRAQSEADKQARRAAAQAPAKPRRLTHQEAKELETMEARIETAEARASALETALADPALWIDGGAGGQEAQQAHLSAQAEVEALYARWEVLGALER